MQSDNTPDCQKTLIVTANNAYGEVELRLATRAMDLGLALHEIREEAHRIRRAGYKVDNKEEEAFGDRMHKIVTEVIESYNLTDTLAEIV